MRQSAAIEHVPHEDEQWYRYQSVTAHHPVDAVDHEPDVGEVGVDIESPVVENFSEKGKNQAGATQHESHRITGRQQGDEGREHERDEDEVEVGHQARGGRAPARKRMLRKPTASACRLKQTNAALKTNLMT